MTTISFLCLLVLLQGGLPSDERDMGWLHGRVVSLTGGVDLVSAGVRVQIADGNVKCDVTSDGSGEFDCKLPKGRYRFDVDDPLGVSYHPFGVHYRRATVYLQAGGRRSVTIRPVPGKPIVEWLPPSGDAAGHVDLSNPAFQYLKDPEFKYEERALPGGDEAVIRYESVTRGGKSVAFRGRYLMLSVETLSIMSDEIECAEDLSRCTARGRVTVDLENETLRGTCLEVDLQARRLTIINATKVDRTF